jgi:hypothetical protein
VAGSLGNYSEQSIERAIPADEPVISMCGAPAAPVNGVDYPLDP